MGLSGLERFEIELHCKIHFFLNPRTLFRDRKRVWNQSWTPWRQTENEYKSNFDLLKRYSCILHYSMDVNLKKKNHLFWKYFSFIIFLVIVTGQWTLSQVSASITFRFVSIIMNTFGPKLHSFIGIKIVQI